MEKKKRMVRKSVYRLLDLDSIYGVQDRKGEEGNLGSILEQNLIAEETIAEEICMSNSRQTQHESEFLTPPVSTSWVKEVELEQEEDKEQDLLI
uniref:Uncharacterized protein n=1 Tax=Cannabis sativa TaxID=3483 RepID=A0A803QEE3_CANSA